MRNDKSEMINKWMSKVLFFAVAILLCLKALFFAYAQESALSSNGKREDEGVRINTSITLSSAFANGVYDQLAQGICRIVNHIRSYTGIRCYTQSSDGSVQNIREVQSNSLIFGLAQSELLYDAFNGLGYFSKFGSGDKLRSVVFLHDEALTIVVRDSGKIKTLDDLVNKAVNLGSESSGVRSVMEDLMSVKGWDRKTFMEVVDLTPAEQASALCRGSIDAMITVEGIPSSSILMASRMCEIEIVPIDPEIINKLIEKNSGYRSVEISGGSYLGVPNKVLTIATKAAIVTNANTSDDIVYDIAKVLFENINYIRQLNPALSKITEDSLYQPSSSIPPHPGVERYIKERAIAEKK